MQAQSSYMAYLGAPVISTAPFTLVISWCGTRSNFSLIEPSLIAGMSVKKTPWQGLGLIDKVDFLANLYVRRAFQLLSANWWANR